MWLKWFNEGKDGGRGLLIERYNFFSCLELCMCDETHEAVPSFISYSVTAHGIKACPSA